jgi:TRAP transporter TAXI family solute receptor
MTKLRVLIFVLLGAAVLVSAGAEAQTRPPAATYEQKKREANDIAVSIMTSGLACTCSRFAEDIRSVVNDVSPGGLRVLPILGVGGIQTLNDLQFLRAIDMGIVDHDDMAALKPRDPQLYGNIEQRIQYITKLFNTELHVLARKEIKSFADLNGQKVNVSFKDSNTDVTAGRLLDMLHMHVEKTYYGPDAAVSKLAKGEINAMLIVSGAPHAAIAKLKSEDGVHFLPLDDASMPGYDLAPVFAEYLPGELTHEMYPNLVPEDAPVQTVVNRALLVTYAWPEGSTQYQKTVRFVNSFFEKIGRFRETGFHPKWAEVNLWADVPGWTRFKPAAEWLASHKAVTASITPAQEQATFDQFLASYRAKVNNRPLSQNEKDFLLRKVKQLLDTEMPKTQ